MDSFIPPRIPQKLLPPAQAFSLALVALGLWFWADNR